MESAIQLAAREVPATPRVVERRDLSETGRTIRLWTVGFFHEDVRLAPAECDVIVEAGQTADASLYCRLPLTAPLRFEPFQLAEDTALDLARNAAEFPAGFGDIQRLLVADGAVATAHYYAVLSDGRRETAVELDGQGNILALGDNTRPFTFDGYDLDYTTGVDTRDTAIEVAAGQPILDTAPHQAGKPNCVGNATPAYTRGFAVCFNDVLRDRNTGEVLQPLAAPRADLDFSNAPGGLDPLPPQVLSFPVEWGGGPVHGTFPQVTARPVIEEQLDVYNRSLGNAQAKAIGPAHHAELQAFYNMAKLQRFYHLFEPALEVNGQDRLRTEITVHWNPSLDNLDDGFRFRGGRHLIKIGAFDNPSDDVVQYDGPSAGDIFAHEYHHHVQESFVDLAGWEKLVTDKDLFPFPPDPGADKCTAAGECRRIFVLEGTADGFASVALGQGVVGTLVSANQSLSALTAACNNRQSYTSGRSVLGNSGTRALCNNEAFGFWEKTDPDNCDRPGQQYEYGVRQLVIGGAIWLYKERFRQAGLGPAFYVQHLLRGERKLKRVTDNELIYLDGMLAYLNSQPAEAARRYVHTARAAFAEKGVFPPLAHLMTGTTLSTLDQRPDLVCETVSCTDERARQISLVTLTASGPLKWSGGSTPSFELFAPWGTSYQSSGGQKAVYLELSATPSFASQQRQQILIDPTNRTNCAPQGFAIRQPSSVAWAAAVNSAQQGSGRVYYRLRQCLASASGPDDAPNCVVSAGGNTPAYVEIDVPGNGCTCRAAGERAPTRPWLPAGLLAAIGVVLLGRRRRP